ncbi:CTP synthase [Candidatus Dojkabacteria bacterium]|uniref:CTP synthase (glutamine hydrolyzing) n=1 Tax=Candidatus Dojkabacteria bacterium TaxID=2099670 RepID=A0A3M0Z473_9BACT|nr:MAG: CTP synthase [Candidatus Dojkabacteria bacterium]
MSQTKYIFVSGGVISGLGKGVTSASLGVLLQSRGYKLSVIKCESYLNIDSGTINPIEHGDPFLCDDGLEADLDLGTYERFLGLKVGRKNFTTMGQVYQTIIEKERNMEYGGKTVDAIPMIPNEIIERIKKAGEGSDICLVELGGTAGEYQNVYNYEAARMMKLFYPDDVIHIHVSYVPVPKHLGEPKSKPTQLSIRFLNMAGIQPDFLVLRSDSQIDNLRREKIAIQCNIRSDRIVENLDVTSVYEIPLLFAEQQFDEKVLQLLRLPLNQSDLREWNDLVSKINTKRFSKVRVAIVGKYISTGSFQLQDSYLSLIEALKHASWFAEIGVDITFVNAEEIEKNGADEYLADVSGIIVPIGWGSRGVEGKIEAIRYARENKIPYLGLCYGMQLACVEYARNVLGIYDAHTEEVDPSTKNKIIHSIPFDPRYQTIKGKGVSMRLGAFDCIIKKDSLAYQIYQKYGIGEHVESGDLKVSERHRHRFEFNNVYRKVFEENGFIFSGNSPDNFFVEMIELGKDMHPFFIATQAHPEYKSTPIKPHPIFIEFIITCRTSRKN